MYFTVTKGSVLAALLFFSASLEMPAQSAGDRAEVRLGYEVLRDAVYNSEALNGIETSYGDAINRLATAGLPRADQELWRSRVEYMLARGYQANGDKTRAIAHYETGLASLEVLAQDQISSESLRMTSECISELCLLKGVGYVVANGPKVSVYAEKALALDPKNTAAQIIIAASKIYPPAIFGGNPRRGIELMRVALSFGTAERDDLFNIYSGIGLAYGKLKDGAEARRWLAMALELYPGSSYARTELEKIGTE